MPSLPPLSLIAVLVLVTGCSEYDGTVILDDPTKLTRVVLGASDPNATIIGITIDGRGRIDGTGRIFLVLNGKPYQTEELDGYIRFGWSGDWYSSLAEVQYEPRNAKGGQIELRYRFEEL